MKNADEFTRQYELTQAEVKFPDVWPKNVGMLYHETEPICEKLQQFISGLIIQGGCPKINRCPPYSRVCVSNRMS